MHYITFEMVSVTASYRNPDFQNFHKSYPLPPPTTIIGMVGAGMGLKSSDAQQFFMDNDVFVSINGKSTGKANDLWKYDDFKNKSVIIRDLLFCNHYQLVFVSESQEITQKIREAFEYPVFALTTGASDSLVKICLPTMQEGITDLLEIDSFENCLVEDDVLTETFEDILKRSRNNFSFSINQRQPIPLNLVTRFEYDSVSETRKAIERKTFSFVSERVTIKQPKRGIRIGNQEFHLFKL